MSNQAFIGVSINDNIIYNILENEVEFKLSGISIINHLNTNPNLFVGKLIESQNYDSIKYIFDNEMKFGEFYSYDNQNAETFENVYNLMKESNDYCYFYIYDYNNDLLIIKTPDIDISALDYKNVFNVRSFCDSLQDEKILSEQVEHYEI